MTVDRADVVETEFLEQRAGHDHAECDRPERAIRDEVGLGGPGH